MKKLFLFSIGLLLSLAAGPLQARNYYVKATGNNTQAGTNLASAWSTIGHAATNMSSGDVIIVSNGTYNEEVTLVKNRCTFISLNKKQAVIKGGMYCIRINGYRKTVVNGFVLKGATVFGVSMTGGASSNTVMNSAIYSNTDGIEIFPDLTDYNTVLSNDIHGSLSSYGIYLDNGDNNVIGFNNIYSNKGHGIYLLHGDNNLIYSNRIHNHSSFGLCLDGNATMNSITGNLIYSNRSYGVQIASDSADDNIFRYNDIWGADQGDAFYIVSGDNNLIKENRLRHHDYGILLDSTATYNVILRNTVCSNLSGGIYLQTSSAVNNTILSNEIKGATQPYGISCNQADQNIFRFNIIHNHAQFGIRLVGSATFNTFSRNTVYSNDTAGVYIPDEAADNNFILSNDVWGANQDECVWIADSDNNVVRANRLSKAQNCGIYLDDLTASGTTGNLIAGNSICSNGLFGLRFVDNYIDDNVIRSNDIFRNATVGLWNGAGDRNVIRDNQFRNNSTGGIGMTFDARSNLISGNRLCSNNQYGIQIDNDSCDANIVEDNTVLGPGQQTGIHLADGDRNSIRGNSLFGNTYAGFLLDGDAVSNAVCNNLLGNNTTLGIYINSDDADFNAVLSNQFQSQSQPIAVNNGDFNAVSRNLFTDNFSFCVAAFGTAQNTGIANNTICHTVANSGIAFLDSASGYIMNNIILSNGYLGITNSSSGTVLISHNCLFGNGAGAVNAGAVLGAHNVFQDPMIDTVTAFLISSAGSPAVNSATNIPGITDSYRGSGPDMGWKEFTGAGDTTPPVTTASKAGGIYAGTIEVVLTAADAELPDNITIYYTTDGSDPVTSSTAVNGISPVTVSLSSTTTLKFYAKNKAGLSEAVKTVQYDFIKLPSEDAAVYNNHLDLSKAEPARIIFGKACTVEIKIYNIKGALVKSWPSRHYDAGQYQDWYGTFRDSTKKVGAGLNIILIKGDINKKLKMTVIK
ncbi:MAG: right-handed parallel beta-helix repeat-containing protein [bacterium]|nr:right-handed parallel beta-helix repeat-containing protein [bacterium]